MNLAGGALIEKFWSQEIQESFNLSIHDWGIISTCTDLHLNGILQNQVLNPIQKFSLNIFDEGVKRMIRVLRLGVK